MIARIAILASLATIALSHPLFEAPFNGLPNGVLTSPNSWTDFNGWGANDGVVGVHNYNYGPWAGNGVGPGFWGNGWNGPRAVNGLWSNGWAGSWRNNWNTAWNNGYNGWYGYGPVPDRAVDAYAPTVNSVWGSWGNNVPHYWGGFANHAVARVI